MTEFLNIPAEYEVLVNIIFLVATGFIAVHGIRYRDEEGRGNFVHMLFGCIAGLFFFAILFRDVLGVFSF